MWLTRFISTLLYGVTPSDATTYVAVPVVIALLAVVACLGPARRAATLDPVKALRS
jgi:ABC-type lipoprotein release transport system permease subunit